VLIQGLVNRGVRLSFTFIFKDRLGNETLLYAEEGQLVRDVLITNGIPPPSVVVESNGQIVHDDHRLLPNNYYEARLIEAYDINFLRDLYKPILESEGISSLYSKRLFLISKNGNIVKNERNLKSLNQLASLIEDRVYDTVATYKLINQNDSVLIGLSGGVDSSAMTTILSEIRKRKDFDFNIIAATFEGFDSRFSPTLSRAKELATRLDIEHHIINADVINEIFNLRKPLHEILQELMTTEYSHFVMYVDHHTTRRALEYFAENNNIKKIALGLHTSDLLGGWLNAIITGYKMANLPLRKIGDLSYVYPLIFISKKELHLYYLAKYGEFIKQSYPNPWELHPKDRNFYYYLADFLQYYWPGIEHWVLHTYIENKETDLKYSTCANCGAHILLQSEKETDRNGLCDVCYLLSKKGYLKENF